MKTAEVIAASPVLRWAGALIALAGLCGFSFAAWATHGDRVLMSVLDSGLAWCF